MISNRLGLAMILVSGFAGAHGPDGTPGSTAVAAGRASVRAAGEGVVYTKPDQARIDIGVVSQAATAQAAGAQNATATQMVLERLRRVPNSKAGIRTGGCSLNPNYRFDRGKRSLNGYNAVNTVEVTSHDLAGLGTLIDAAIEAGANQIQLKFGLKDEKPACDEALHKATEDARSSAAAMASALGLKLGRVLSLEQGAAEPARPVMAAAEAHAIEVRAAVILTMAVE